MTTRKSTALDWWIAATMTWHPRLAQHLDARGISRDELMLRRAALEADGLRFPLQISRDDALKYFGNPTSATGDRLLYAPVWWPEHRYEFEFGSDGKVSGLGFRHPHLFAPLDANKVRDAPAALLRPWYHTAHDIESILGRPAKEQEWWPGRTVQYHLGKQGLMTLAYDHELLVSVEVAK